MYIEVFFKTYEDISLEKDSVKIEEKVEEEQYMIEGFKNQVLSLLSFSWPMIAIGVIIAVLLRTTYLLVNKEKLVIHEELFKLCFIIYILCLFYAVTFQDVSWASHNYIPFKEKSKRSFMKVWKK